MKSKRAREAAEVDDKPVNGAVAEDVPAKKRKRDDDNEADAAGAKKVKKDKKEKKDKKDKKDKKHKKESRKEKKDKRKDLQDLPEEEPEEEPEQQQQNGDAPANAPKEEKVAVTDAEKDKKQKKKEKKQKQKKAKEDAAAASTTNGAATNGDAANNQDAEAKDNSNAIDLDQSTAEKQDRHIVFVGNLPFTATAATISAHFASLSPIAVRCLKNKDDDNPCRGIAFVEFGKVWHQRTCLDKFHHSLFDDGKSPARKINVELTYVPTHAPSPLSLTTSFVTYARLWYSLT